MSQEERRKHQRLRLRLGIRDLLEEGRTSCGEGVFTSNISAGGVYFSLDPATPAPAHGANLSFQLVVPPGEGYSTAPGRIKGTGQVVRMVQQNDGGVGVALQFTQPLGVTF